MIDWDGKDQDTLALIKYIVDEDKLEIMPEPAMASELPKVKLNLKGVRQYAKEKGVSIASFMDAEKKLFTEA